MFLLSHDSEIQLNSIFSLEVVQKLLFADGTLGESQEEVLGVDAEVDHLFNVTQMVGALASYIDIFVAQQRQLMG